MWLVLIIFVPFLIWESVRSFTYKAYWRGYFEGYKHGLEASNEIYQEILKEKS